MSVAIMSFLMRHDACRTLATDLAAADIGGVCGGRNNTGQQESECEAFHHGLHRLLWKRPGKDQRRVKLPSRTEVSGVGLVATT